MRYFRKKSKFVGIMALALLIQPCFFHIQAQETKTKANYILNFIKLIGWTEEQKNGDFIIGVVGKEAQAEALRVMSEGKKFGFQNIVIKDFAKANKITPCQVLFVSDNAFFDLLYEKIVLYGGKTNFLLITEEKDAQKYGSVINFFNEGDTVKFEFSEENAQKLNLKYNTKLINYSSN